jgi:hypothetical protein
VIDLRYVNPNAEWMTHRPRTDDGTRGGVASCGKVIAARTDYGGCRSEPMTTLELADEAIAASRT